MKTWLVLLVSALPLFLAACASQPTPMAFDPPGFFSGLLQGFVAPYALFGRIFLDVRIYAFPNSRQGLIEP